LRSHEQASFNVEVSAFGEDALGLLDHKLSRSGADERHAFLILPGFAAVGFSVTDLLCGTPPHCRRRNRPSQST
jgi:hypothetical protein